MPSSAAALDAHDDGGSTISMARRSRQNRPATSSVDRPDVVIARQRRNAQQVDVRRGVQREDAGAACAEPMMS